MNFPVRCPGQLVLVDDSVEEDSSSSEQEIGDDILLPPNCAILNPLDLVSHSLLCNAARYIFILS